jgi:hypothetical protein
MAFADFQAGAVLTAAATTPARQSEVVEGLLGSYA